MTWPLNLAMTLTLNFQGKNLEFAISQARMVQLPRIGKQTYRLISRPLNVTNGFDLDLWILMVKFWNSCISEWEGWLALNKGGGRRSFMTMTIWWPRSGVRIYLHSGQGDFRCGRAVDSSSLYCEHYWPKWPHYSRTTLYHVIPHCATTIQQTMVTTRDCHCQRNHQFLDLPAPAGRSRNWWFLWQWQVLLITAIMVYVSAQPCHPILPPDALP